MMKKEIAVTSDEISALITSLPIAYKAWREMLSRTDAREASDFRSEENIAKLFDLYKKLHLKWAGEKLSFDLFTAFLIIYVQGQMTERQRCITLLNEHNSKLDMMIANTDNNASRPNPLMRLVGCLRKRFLT